MGMIKSLRKARKNLKKQKEEKLKNVPSVQSPGGTWFNAENLGDDPTTDLDIYKSSHSIESASTYGTAISFSSSPTSSTDTTDSGWTSSGEKNHHKGSPLIARRNCPDGSSSTSKKDIKETSSRNLIDIKDEPLELGRVMARSRRLPKHSWYYANNHIQVNNERSKRTIAPLLRNPILDEAAREHARLMAQRADDQPKNEENEDQKEMAAFHSDPRELRSKLIYRELKRHQEQEKQNEEVEQEGTVQTCNGIHKDYNHFRRIGENVAVGNTIQEIHMAMMSDLIADKNNILDRRYIYFGMGTAKSEVTGKLYLCQIFQG